MTQPAKLKSATPAAGISEDAEFEVEVSYFGTPHPIVDTDRSCLGGGWRRACSSPGNCDGSYTVNEPIGARTGSRGNNHPSDKATFVLRDDRPHHLHGDRAGAKPGLPDPERRRHRDHDLVGGLRRWRPTSRLGTVGRFDVDEGTMIDQAGGSTIPTFTAIDSAGSAQRSDLDVLDTAARIPKMVNFLSERFGPYPFGTVGVVADWAPSVGYALENQTKPHFAGNDGGPAVYLAGARPPAGPSMDGRQHLPGTVDGHLVQPRGGQRSRRGLLRRQGRGGRAVAAEVLPRSARSDRARRGGCSPLGSTAIRQSSSTCSPAELPRGRWSKGYRQIVGDPRFYAFAEGPVERYAYGNIKRRQFVRRPELASGFRGRKLKRLGRLFPSVVALGATSAADPPDFRR